MKAEVDKLDINKLVNNLTGLNKLKTKIDDLDVGKFKTLPIDFKKKSDVVSKKIVKNAKFNTLNAKVNILENKIPDQYTLIQNLVKKIKDVENKIQSVSYLVTASVLNTKIREMLRIKFLMLLIY